MACAVDRPDCPESLLSVVQALAGNDLRQFEVHLGRCDQADAVLVLAGPVLLVVELDLHHQTP